MTSAETMVAEQVTPLDDVSPAAVTLHNVNKSFRLRSASVQAVTGIDITIQANRITSLVGPSGCGKTSLLRMVAGFDFPTSGEVVTEGVPVEGIRTGIGYLTQEADLFPWMTLHDNVSFPLEMLGIPGDVREPHIDAYLELVGLVGFGDHFPHQLSGGMRQRGALARTMIYDPTIILMDEPFSGLDMPTRLMLHDQLLRLLADRPKTVILVTHDISEAIALSDTVIVMSKRPGKVKAQFEIDLPRPRTSSGAVNLPGYSEIYNAIWDALYEEFDSVATDEGSTAVAPSLPASFPAARRHQRPPGGRLPSGGGVTGPVTAPAPAPARRRHRPARRPPPRLATLGLRVLVLLAFLGLWQILASTHVLSPLLFASPVSVVQRLGELLGGTNVQGHTIYADALATLQEMAIGYVIGAAVGLTLGFWFARSEWLARIFEPLILVSYTIPKIALAPVFILLLGIGLESKVAIVAMELFFLVFFNTFTGVKGVNEDYVRQARISGAPMRKIVRRIVFPAALPSIMLGLEMGIPFAMVGAVIGEFMAANKGLGWLVTYSASVFDPKDMFSGLIAIIAVVWVLSAALRLLKYKLLPWQADEGSQSRRPVTE